MKIIIKMLLLGIVFLFPCFASMSFADDIVKFRLEIKPNQQKVEAHVDGDEHKQINIKAEYVKLNTVTNNYHIKVTITNNSGHILYHQLALIDKVEHSEVKYPDSTTCYIKNDDGKQITKTIPYYNYGNIKQNQSTPREWYLSNTGKEEIGVEGYIISKEIPIVLDPKIAAANPGVAQTLTAFITALQNNDLDGVLAVVAKPDKYFEKDLIKRYSGIYNNYPGAFQRVALYYIHPTSIRVVNHITYMDFNWVDPDDGISYSSSLQLGYDNTKWWITE